MSIKKIQKEVVTNFHFANYCKPLLLFLTMDDNPETLALYSMVLYLYAKINFLTKTFQSSRPLPLP